MAGYDTRIIKLIDRIGRHAVQDTRLWLELGTYCYDTYGHVPGYVYEELVRATGYLPATIRRNLKAVIWLSALDDKTAETILTQHRTLHAIWKLSTGQNPAPKTGTPTGRQILLRALQARGHDYDVAQKLYSEFCIHPEAAKIVEDLTNEPGR
jgi:hypothetical protein